jgi:hypothetical protein
MRTLRRFFIRLREFVTVRRQDERLRQEMEMHLAMQAEENIRAGMPPAAAHRQARIKFGPAEARREEYRAEAGLPLIENLLRDTRYALRQLCKTPGFYSDGSAHARAGYRCAHHSRNLDKCGAVRSVAAGKGRALVGIH